MYEMVHVSYSTDSCMQNCNFSRNYAIPDQNYQWNFRVRAEKLMKGVSKWVWYISGSRKRSKKESF